MQSSEESRNNREKIILGIDPGTTIMGYGLIKITGKNPELLTMGVLHLDKYDNHAIKLQKIFLRTLSLIDEYHPDEMAIEAPFFGKNVQSMLKLGRAQGVAIAAALYRDVPMVEYEPRKIKQSITGSGSATKEQVAIMLQRLFKIRELPKHLDATDGLAAAVCHFYKSNSPTGEKGHSSWKAFISDNPTKILK